MLTKIRIRNFKRFEDVEFDLGQAVVLIGPNNSGKTTALQALALWDIGLRRWNEKNAKRKGKAPPEERPGVTVNRRDLISIPVPDANLLWRDLHVRTVRGAGSQLQTQNVRVDITVEGVSGDTAWRCGLEFDYANQESFYCRPLRMPGTKPVQRMAIPPAAAGVRVAFLPPMSGLAATEPKWEQGRVNVLLGEGQTAQVLRNLCYRVYSDSPSGDWLGLVQHVKALFGVELGDPKEIAERGEITMAYREPPGPELDLSSAGRGLQQTLLLLVHMYANPGTVLLLDEPDAHLEVLRQRQTYQLITDVARQQGSQIIAASHSEVILNEAAGRDVVIAFVGKPHRMDKRGSQVLKSLKDIGFDQYYQAEQTGWVLYLEGSTDLAILKGFARTLDHPAANALSRPFVHYLGTNLPNRAEEHFGGLCEAKPDLLGLALYDQLEREPSSSSQLRQMTWKRREIENYICQKDVLIAFARGDTRDLWAYDREEAMRASIAEIEDALMKLRKLGPWSPDTKVTDDFLDPLFDAYFGRLRLPNQLRKSDYHELAYLVPKEAIDPEVIDKLDAIAETDRKASS